MALIRANGQGRRCNGGVTDDQTGRNSMLLADGLSDVPSSEDGAELVERTHERVPRGAGGVRADVLAARAAHLQETVAIAPPRPRRRRPRRPEVGLALALVLGLAAAFLGAVSADPFWLALGAGDRGTVTVTRCTGGTVTGDCIGRYVPASGSHRVAVTGVRISSLPAVQRTVGASVSARLLDRDGGWAYAGSASGLNLRWMLGFLLAIGCGLGTAMATGVPWLVREHPHRARLLWGLAVGGPMALFLGAVLAGLVG
jgi:hypothetical protein